MFELRKTFTFEASHRLLHHDGKCAHMHGHSYKLIIEISADGLQTTGSETNMVLDFQNLSKPVKKLVNSHLDHRHLNESLDTDSPTAEYIAWWVYQRLKSSIPHLSAVTVCETATSSATYRPTTHCSGCRCGHPPINQTIPGITSIANGTIDGTYTPKTSDTQKRDAISIRETKH